jgi:hypothetical protein
MGRKFLTTVELLALVKQHTRDDFGAFVKAIRVREDDFGSPVYFFWWQKSRLFFQNTHGHIFQTSAKFFMAEHPTTRWVIEQIHNRRRNK